MVEQSQEIRSQNASSARESSPAAMGALHEFDEKWLESFYKECGREVTLAYTTLNQMKNWAIVTAAAVISGLSFGTSAEKYPNIPMFTGIVIVYAFVLRFYIRGIVCYVNLIRWNTLQNACVESKLWSNTNTEQGKGGLQSDSQKLGTAIRNYYFLWLSPINRKSQLVQNLRLGFMLLFTLVLFFLIWGFVILRNDPIVRGLGVWVAGITFLELYDFSRSRIFDDLNSYQKKLSKEKTDRVFPIPESSYSYLAKWLLVLAISIAVAIFSPKITTPKTIQLGSLNESGTPVEFVAELQSRLKGYLSSGHVGGTIQNQQAIEGLQITVDQQKSAFEVTNNSKYYIDQLSFACDVGRNDFTFFLWSVGVKGEYPAGEIQWLTPGTNRRSFPDASLPSDHVILLHNDMNNYETLGTSQLNWLIRKYEPHDCLVLDVSDAREEKPESVKTPNGTKVQ
jgi:hypothetical protein